jgi:hypothetical protein
VSDGNIDVFAPFQWFYSNPSTNCNTPPKITNPGPQEGSEGQFLSFDIEAEDIDEDDFWWTDFGSLPPGLSLTPNQGGPRAPFALVSGTPDPGSAGDYEVTIQANDTYHLDVAHFTFTIYESGGENTLPEVTHPGNQSHDQGTTLDPPLTIVVTDAQNEAISCDMTGLPDDLTWYTPAGQSVCVVEGTITAEPGNYSVWVRASDDGGVTYGPQVNFTWHVTNPGGGGGGTPELPPDPADSPGVTPDEINVNSRVGATSGSFQVDESGSATYSIPILTAPGSGGVAPQISLDYSSRDGNSIAGLGWSIGGQSAITRCGQTLVQDGSTAERGITLTYNDRFCLDGERLMLISDGASY